MNFLFYFDEFFMEKVAKYINYKIVILILYNYRKTLVFIENQYSKFSIRFSLSWTLDSSLKHHLCHSKKCFLSEKSNDSVETSR